MHAVAATLNTGETFRSPLGCGDPMAEPQSHEEGLRSRSTDAVTDLANALLDNPLFSQALGRALGMGEKAAQAQRRAMDAVGLPSAEEISRLERRIRSLSDRLETVEDQLDRVARDVGLLRRQLAAAEEVSADQSTLKVSESD
jgi:histidine ammonia-lyase